jgi:hypothetical protein
MCVLSPESDQTGSYLDIESPEWPQWVTVYTEIWGSIFVFLPFSLFLFYRV